MNNPQPAICMIMPVCNGAQDIIAALRSVGNQIVSVPARCIVVDNGSRDGTQDLVAHALVDGVFRGSLITLNERSIPLALNTALKNVCPTETVVRLDAHTIYDPAYCQTIVDAFNMLPSDVWCVGGSQRPAVGADFGQQLVYSLMTNPLGLGGAAFRTDATSRQVAGVYLGAWRPGVLHRLGGFNERWRANEDAELSERLAAAGGKTWLIPAISHYIITRGPSATVRQWGRYGYWRAQTIKQYPRSLRVRHVIPPLAFISFVACLLSSARVILFIPITLYAIAIYLRRRNGEPLSVTLASVPFFACAHTAFAGGILTGLLSFRNAVDRTTAGNTRDRSLLDVAATVNASEATVSTKFPK